MGREKFLVSFVVASLFLFSNYGFSFSEQDYSDIKGDFKIFCLGDSLDAVKQKASYLIERGEVRAHPSNLPFTYRTLVFDSEASLHFSFSGDKVNKIGIIFQELYLTENDFDVLYENIAYLKYFFTKTYGGVTTENVLPNLKSMYSFEQPKVTDANSDYNMGGLELSQDNPHLQRFPKKKSLLAPGLKLKSDAILWEKEIGVYKHEETINNIIMSAINIAQSEYLDGVQNRYPISYVFQWELPNKTVSVGLLLREFGCFIKVEIQDSSVEVIKSDFN